MKCMCSDRTNLVLFSQEKTYLSMFIWDKLLGELKEMHKFGWQFFVCVHRRKSLDQIKCQSLACVLP